MAAAIVEGAKKKTLGAMIRHLVCVANSADDLGINNMSKTMAVSVVQLVAQWADEYGVNAAQVCAQTQLPLQ